jgi:hypothetical protein
MPRSWIRWQKSRVVAAPAESDDVNRVIVARPGPAQMRVRLVDARQFAQPEYPAEDLADRRQPRADSRHVEVVLVRVFVIRLVKSKDVCVLGLRIVTVFRCVPCPVKCIKSHRCPSLPHDIQPFDRKLSGVRRIACIIVQTTRHARPLAKRTRD